MFSLVNGAGDVVNSFTSQRLLLLYYHKTVCNHGFTDAAAAAICREMGHAGAIGWTSGELHSIQTDLQIGLSDVVCSGDSWESCTFTTEQDCDHSEDVHLVCDVRGNFSII